MRTIQWNHYHYESQLMRKMILDMGLCLYGVWVRFQLKHADDDSPHKVGKYYCTPHC